VAASIATLWFLSHLTGGEAIGILILIGIFTIVFFGKRFAETRTAAAKIKTEPVSEPKKP
jgi:hypothetical protein